MKPTRLTLTLAATVLIIGGPAALGSPREGSFRSKAAGPAYWGQPGAWEIYDRAGWRAAGQDDGVPGRGRAVTIQAGHTVVVSTNQDVRKLLIIRAADGTGPGTLEITSGGMLTIHKGLSMARRPEDAASARIVFSGSGREPGVLHSNVDFAIFGDVEVLGRAGGVIRTARQWFMIAVARQARLSATGGPLTISGVMEMDGQIIADGPFAVTVTGHHLKEGSSGLWKIAHPAARIKFDTLRPITLRSGRIVVEEGTLDIATNFKSSGRVTNKRGTINVAPNRSFDVRGMYVDSERKVRVAKTRARTPRTDK